MPWWHELIVREAAVQCSLIIINFFYTSLLVTEHYIYLGVSACSDMMVWDKGASLFPLVWWKPDSQMNLPHFSRGLMDVGIVLSLPILPLDCSQYTAVWGSAEGTAVLPLFWTTFVQWLTEVKILLRVGCSQPDLPQSTVKCEVRLITSWWAENS